MAETPSRGVRVPKEEWEPFQAICAKRNETMTDRIRHWIRQDIANEELKLSSAARLANAVDELAAGEQRDELERILNRYREPQPLALGEIVQGDES